MILTRRLALTTLGVVPLATAQAPAPASPPDSPGQLLRKAEEEVRTVSARLAQIQVAQNREPAFLFRP